VFLGIYVIELADDIRCELVCEGSVYKLSKELHGRLGEQLKTL
jgi:hypothetical protein